MKNLHISSVFIFKLLLCSSFKLSAASQHNDAHPNSDIADFVSPSAVSHNLDRGKNKIKEIKMKMNIPKHGECWTSAVKQLEATCKIMDGTMQTKLTFAFTICFLDMVGLPFTLCDINGDIHECVKNSDSRQYDTFLEYFLHTQDMCFYVTSQLWQEETDKTVNRLANAAVGVSETLEGTKQAQDQILKAQQDSLKVQSTIMKDNSALYSTIITFKQIFDDLTAYTYRDYDGINNQLIKDMHTTLHNFMKLQNNSQGPQHRKEIEENRNWIEHHEQYSSSNNSESEYDSDSNYSRDSDSVSDVSDSEDIETGEQESLMQDLSNMFPEHDKENKPINKRVMNVLADDDVPVGPPVLTSTPISTSRNGSATPTHRYNLRERKSTTPNPFLKTETAKDFVYFIIL